MLYTSEGPVVVTYLEGKAQSLIANNPGLIDYRHAIDLVSDGTVRLYNSNSPGKLSDFARDLQQKFSQLTIQEIEQIRNQAAARKFFSDSPTEPSVVSLLLELKRAGADDKLEQAQAQKGALMQDFDARLAAVRPEGLDALGAAQKALAELFGAADPLVASRTRDLADRTQQFAAAKAQQQQQQARETAQADALAALAKIAQSDSLDLPSLRRFIEQRGQAAQLGADQTKIDGFSHDLAARLAQQLRANNAPTREELGTAMQMAAAGLLINPADPALKKLQASLQIRLDSITTAKERTDQAIAQLGDLIAHPRADAAWLGDYQSKLGDVLRNVSGGLNGAGDLLPRTLAGLLQAGRGAAGAHNFALAEQILAEIRQLSPNDPAVSELGDALAQAHKAERLNALAAAQGDIELFLRSPSLSGEGRRAYERALPGVLSDQSPRSTQLIAQLAAALQQQVTARIDAQQFDAAQQYLEMLRKLPDTSAAAADLASRVTQAQGAAEQARAKSQRIAALNEIITEVNANQIRQARTKLDALRAQYPGTDEVKQATDQFASSLESLANQDLMKGNKSNDVNQYALALDLVKQSLVYGSTPERTALRDKLEKLIDEARHAANTGAPAGPGTSPAVPTPESPTTSPQVPGTAAPGAGATAGPEAPTEAGTTTGAENPASSATTSGPPTSASSRTAAGPRTANNPVTPAGPGGATNPVTATNPVSRPDSCLASKNCSDEIVGGSGMTIALYRISQPQADSHRAGYALGTTEISNAEFNIYCKATGACGGEGNAEMPHVNVTPEQAQQYAKWLSNATGFTYRLPSFAEWHEVAAQADVQSANCPSAGQLGQDTSQVQVDVVGSSHGTARSKAIKNIVGNVGELVSEGGGFVVAGGSVNDVNCSADTRHDFRGPDDSTGFRLLREINPP